ncbi:MAG: palindromic element RPE1 domain-containing protein [Rickettsiaceae bacterium]|nr:palindromic element RPE1 domain-containing protein [Rickettsiaceae bacterium]MDD9337769.1 palindromic element RPE1 domain-containing protein [Rickettsiaceae bacterium]
MNVHEDSSTGLTYKSPVEVEFRKKSNVNFHPTHRIIILL